MLTADLSGPFSIRLTDKELAAVLVLLDEVLEELELDPRALTVKESVSVPGE